MITGLSGALYRYVIVYIGVCPQIFVSPNVLSEPPTADPLAWWCGGWGL